jgi:2-polyprenyl-3-methyl-5-hydroxy-6-metoxy-1,4-benzoquinol methylase
MITSLLRKIMTTLWSSSARESNRLFTLQITSNQPKLKVLDIGSYHPSLVFEKFTNLINPSIHAVDVKTQVVKLCTHQGITAKQANAEKKLPFPPNRFDIVTANQIIEHILNIDQFMSEIRRVLKPGGKLVLSTENLSAWHNIFALIMGWQAFSQHISSVKNIGNPFRIHSQNTNLDLNGMHIKIFTLRGLTDLLTLYGFSHLTIFSAGYPPLPYPLSKWLSQIDPTHATFIGIVGIKL